MRTPKMTTRRWMLVVALVAIALVAVPMAALLVRDAREKAEDERWANPWLRAGDDYDEAMRKLVERPPP
jgi:hypothetical protein